MTEGFTWEKIGLYFPEWFLEPGTEERVEWQEKGFPAVPKLKDLVLDFAFKRDYGVQLWFNQGIPLWLRGKKVTIEGEALEGIYHKLCMSVYHGILPELERVFFTLEKWREKYVHKFNRKIDKWEGPLPNHIDFRKIHYRVGLGDYFSYGGNSVVSRSASPTDKLLAIKKLPVSSLNEKWLEYRTLSDYVIGGGKNCSNEITGKDLAECVERADQIYSIADELRDLKF